MAEEPTVEDLKQQVQELRQEVADLNRRLLEDQVEAWRSRIDELDVQLHLAEMDARDEVAPLIDQLNDQWARARSQLDQWSDSAGDAVHTLRDGVQGALDDLRASLRQAVNQLRS